jgi:Family of unknown function (DUF6252)
MKNIVSLLVVLITCISCQDNVKLNDKAFQAQKDDSFWRAIDSKAYLSSTGKLTIEGLTEHEIVTLTTASKNLGTYPLGTINLANKAMYNYSEGSALQKYETNIVSGSANKLNLSYQRDNVNSPYYYVLNSGTGYTSEPSAETTSNGTGFGLKVKTTVAGGVVTRITIASPGNNYKAGDIITIKKGALVGNATFAILNTSKSNGEVVITEYDGATVSGTFKFNAPKTTGLSTDPEALNYQYGTFYKVPILPAP